MTSESVTEGHPDKICDQISDGILDAYLSKDSNARVAIEVMASRNTIMIAGEVTSSARLEIAEIARNILINIGYTDNKCGIDGKNCIVMTNVNEQSTDIAQGVDRVEGIGAGDQGIMYGYACDETKNLMPITIDIANTLSKRLAFVRKQNILPWLLPDGKTQITMEYDENYCPIKITSIIVSAQHTDAVCTEHVHSEILEKVIRDTLGSEWISCETSIHINPTGRFVTGGPDGDTGLTGRKIIADTYGGVARHGGGAFSGKDPTKVDRSAAYMARYVAKNIVAAKLAKRCEVSLAYAIGREEPEAVRVDTFGTEKVDIEYINFAVRAVFSFAVKDILEILELRKPQYLKTSTYGHFGKEDCGFAWERVDKAKELKLKVIEFMTNEVSM